MRTSLVVNVRHDIDGKQTPLSIIWVDGRTFEVDRIHDICRAASLKASGVGMRYTCSIRNKQIYLYDEEGFWFLEG
ncbi:MAG: hypothetical protein A2Y15_05990 [Clostridiales bacterium GWF2_36_10]|nr:MAG: hypothetical protein A2Y15_05990 [Clostridiales bacterium GWF2_36_10]HAN21591.1 hypothetical protein [Clostridiales bacterium]